LQNDLKNFIRPERFCGNVLIARHGKIIFQGAYGYADEENKVPNEMDTQFCVGSVSKSVTALCLMKLVQEKKLELTDTIDQYFGHLYPGQGLTIHHLLTHTSGIRNHLSVRKLKHGKKYVLSEVLTTLAETPLEFAPGEQFLYSNTGYALLGTIIEKVTGRNLHDYIRTAIFTPLKMKDSFFLGETVEHLAKPESPQPAFEPGLLYASGALISTVKDLFRYDQALYEEKIIRRDLIERMMRPLYNGRFIKYGYGWFIKHNFGQRSVAHGGYLLTGYSAHLERYIDDRTTIIVASNKAQRYSRLGMKRFNSTDLARELAAKIYGKKVRFWQRWY